MAGIEHIRDSFLCYGCGTCNVVCNHNAIEMYYDNIGRLLPHINDKCVQCGLCGEICPSLDIKRIQLPNTDDKYVGKILGVWTGRANDEIVYDNSQSGGLVTATIKYLFETGKIDAAIMCRVEDAIEYTPKVVAVTSIDELYLCQKSSYVPIDIVSGLNDVEQYANIAIVGTGCHIEGIRALQIYKKEYKEKIKYTLGLICDRTLCKTATDVLYGDVLIEGKKRIVWRDKSINYKNARLLIKTENDDIMEIPTWKRFALKDAFTNPRCRICFDKLNVHADIVYGDPWGMSNVDWEKGMSVVITRTTKGAEVISNLMNSNYAVLNPATLKEFLSGQHIEQRRKDVSSALVGYIKMGWMAPSYGETLYSSPYRMKQRRLLAKFASNSKLPKERIISNYISYLHKVSVIYLIKRIVKVTISLFSVKK